MPGREKVSAPGHGCDPTRLEQTDLLVKCDAEVLAGAD